LTPTFIKVKEKVVHRRDPFMKIQNATLTSLLFLSASLMANAAVINGAGSSLAMPLYSKWISEFTAKSPTTKINYNSVGSGAGIREFLANTVDFGATDAPMKDEELKQATGAVLHIPVALAAVVLTYNIPGVKTQLNLDAETIRNIYVGKITNWNDPTLAKLNPTVKFPKLAILPVYRADGSGTTAVFSEYLSKADATWKKDMGTGKSLNWPTGVGAKGNEGVSGTVKSSKGSIGYVESTYATENALATAKIKNEAGEFIGASLTGISEAAASVTFPKDYRGSITYTKGKTSYPISGVTFALVYKKILNENGPAILSFFKHVLGEGQVSAGKIGFAPVPEKLRSQLMIELNGVSVK
jgi:phosphate transport system substrate-binding protein